MRRLCCALAVLLAVVLPARAQHPRDGEIHSPDTLAWWHTTEDLAGDGMEGRDTGTAAYGRAADYVAKRFAAAGLKPAGDAGGYFQTVPMHELDLTPQGTSFTVVHAGGKRLALRFLYEITAAPASGMLHQAAGAMTFRGYCGDDAMGNITGKIVMCFGTQRSGLPSGAERAANARKAGALGLINVDDPSFSLEPPRWPYAYARSVTLRESSGEAGSGGEHASMLPTMRLSAEAFYRLLETIADDPERPKILPGSVFLKP